MKRKLKYLCILILVTSTKVWSQEPVLVAGGLQVQTEKHITINGLVKNYPENAKVVLANTGTGKVIDSTFVKNGVFSFKVPKMDSTMVGVFIDNNDLRYYTNEMVPFFIEDKDIVIKGEKGQLKYAKVKGGIVQDQMNEYRGSIEDLSKQFDELNEAGFKAADSKQTAKVESIGKQQDIIIQERIDIGMKYLEDNPSHYWSLKRLIASMPALSIDRAAELFQQLDDKLKNHREGKYIKSIIEQKQLKVGDIAPNFRLTSIDGKKISLSDFKGKYVLVDFWASWCGPCRIENKNLLENYKSFNSQGFEILSISGDKDKEKWVKASEKDSIIWTNLIESKGGTASRKFNVLLIPTSFLIDPSGKVIGKNIKGDALREKLDMIYNR